jgi:phosphatidylinositol alpha-1,6-mannosyltransferase
VRWHVVTVDLPPARTGGVAAWTDDAATALAATGEVTVYARHDGDTAAWDAARPYRVVRMRGRSWGRRQALWAVAQAGPRLRPGDALLCTTWPVAALLSPFARGRGVPVVVAAHGSEVTMLAAPPAPLRRIGGRVSWLPVSGFLARELDRLGGGTWRRTVAPSPLDPGPAPAEVPRAGLLVVARPTPLKGVARVATLGRALGLPVSVIGGGPAVPGVTALGPLPRAEARAAMARAAAVALLPRTDPAGRGAEGLGLVLLEAAAAGTPVVGCRTGGVPEAVGPGLLLDDPDRPDLDAVRTLLADPTAGRRARAWLEATHGPARFRDALAEAAS